MTDGTPLVYPAQAFDKFVELDFIRLADNGRYYTAWGLEAVRAEYMPVLEHIFDSQGHCLGCWSGAMAGGIRK